MDTKEYMDINMENQDTQEVVAAVYDPDMLAEQASEAVATTVAKKEPRQRSQKYQSARSIVDRTIEYPVQQAVEMAQRASYTKFDGTLTLHLNLKKEMTKAVELSLPFSTGKTVRVAIADEALIADLDAGKVEFDVLLATPQIMPKLAKYARLLGPKGLMPNPKNGTVTSDPETKKASLGAGTVSIKAEKKAPLIHVRVGKTKQAAAEIAENIQAIFKAVGTFAIAKATVAPTMGPGVKVRVE